MIKKYELISEEDIKLLNSFIGKLGIIADHDLFGSPVIYVDHKLLEELQCIKPKIRRTYVSEETKQKVIRLHNSGMNYRNISKETGISLGSITKIIKAAR